MHYTLEHSVLDSRLCCAYALSGKMYRLDSSSIEDKKLIFHQKVCYYVNLDKISLSVGTRELRLHLSKAEVRTKES